ncbi:hypothetical protein H0H92_003868 [Tricholoma furcatifolium]|nr:hypothetical protein H0H92_003868 [Tricholoma furcatifolium]
MVDGVKTLELDNGITKDGIVVVCHDQYIAAEKCQDTAPAVGIVHFSVLTTNADRLAQFPDDADYPYVGKYIVNLTLAQIRTLDCGSQRLNDFREPAPLYQNNLIGTMQLSYPRTTIPTLEEVFDFVACADPQRKMQFNIESKIDPTAPDHSHDVDVFVNLQHAAFKNSGYDFQSIISFDWRTLIGMKALEPRIPTAALVSRLVLQHFHVTSGDINGTTAWLAGLQLRDFPGATIDVKIAEAAKSIDADILSPSYISSRSPVTDPSQSGYIPFTTKTMVDHSHELGMKVIPWTVNRWNAAEELFQMDIDGIITDYPTQMRRLIEKKGLGLAPVYDQEKVFECLSKFSKY